MSDPLFEPFQMGSLSLPNRIVMAAMTRSRADEAGNVGELTALYYAQRAAAGLIVSEGIYPEPMGKGYVRTPGLVTVDHVRGWRRVTDAVHKAGGRIVAQIMHVGRISDRSFLPGNAVPVAPSAIRPKGESYTDNGMVPFETPRALEIDEIDAILRSYGEATRRALDAGFDGVELHAGSGYLPMQFLSSGSNLRTDRYGGSVRNRTRFTLEALDRMVAVAGSARVGLKLTPGMTFNDALDADPVATYAGLVERLGDLAFLEVVNHDPWVDFHQLLRPLFSGAYLIGGGLTQETAAQAVGAGRADAAVFGAPFIANPDLPARFKAGVPLAVGDRATFYAPGAVGYVDYPTMALSKAA